MPRNTIKIRLEIERRPSAVRDLFERIPDGASALLDTHCDVDELIFALRVTRLKIVRDTDFDAGDLIIAASVF